MKKMISIITPCFNEEKNVENIYQEVKNVMKNLPEYNYEHIFIDNSSEDRTVEILKKIAKKDKNVKIILNARNFGTVRSPYYGLLQSNGDAGIIISADSQEPPELIEKFIRIWEKGYKIVAGVKRKSEGSIFFSLIRKTYYNFLNRLSEIKLIENFMGFGLYDKKVINILRELDDPYPYLRGLICEIGFKVAKVPYLQKSRQRGITKNNFYTLYDMAMLGVTNHSKVPLRLATMFGFLTSIFSFLLGLLYFVNKLLNWDSFELGLAPLIIGVFFFFSINLFFLGILGEYIGAIQTQILKRPLVVEKERINFKETYRKIT
tara:strand:- start:11371 stop:12327 length:957 start_codon:yes stop_codon:yes gene_type:complete